MAQLVGIAHALTVQPGILLCDELLGALDAMTKRHRCLIDIDPPRPRDRNDPAFVRYRGQVMAEFAMD